MQIACCDARRWERVLSVRARVRVSRRRSSHRRRVGLEQRRKNRPACAILFERAGVREPRARRTLHARTVTMGSTRRDRKAAEPAAAEPATAGKRGAPAPAEDEPDAKAAKKAEPEPAAKDVAPDEAAPMDADQEGGDADAEGDEVRRSFPRASLPIARRGCAPRAAEGVLARALGL